MCADYYGNRNHNSNRNGGDRQRNNSFGNNGGKRFEGDRSGNGPDRRNRKPAYTAPEVIELSKGNFVDHAEEAIKSIRDPNSNRIKITTSKIRNILSMTTNLATKASQLKSDKLTEEMFGEVQVVRMHIAYEAGRDNDVRTFVENSHLLEYVMKIKNDDPCNKDKLLIFCRYIEALVAFQRFYGGSNI